MELDKESFFKNYGLNQFSTETEFRDFILKLSNDDKALLVTFIKNLLTIRILEISEREKGIQQAPQKIDVLFLKTFKKRHLIRTMNRISDEMGIFFPPAIMSNASILISLLSLVGWILIIVFFLYHNIAVLFSGIELLLIPFYLIFATAPYLLLTTLFPTYFAQGQIKGVKSLGDFIEEIFRMNFKMLREDDYYLVVKELVIIKKSHTLQVRTRGLQKKNSEKIL